MRKSHSSIHSSLSLPLPLQQEQERNKSSLATKLAPKLPVYMHILYIFFLFLRPMTYPHCCHNFNIFCACCCNWVHIWQKVELKLSPSPSLRQNEDRQICSQWRPRSNERTLGNWNCLCVLHRGSWFCCRRLLPGVLASKAIRHVSVFLERWLKILPGCTCKLQLSVQ